MTLPVPPRPVIMFAGRRFLVGMSEVREMVSEVDDDG